MFKISLKKNTIANYIGQMYVMVIGIVMLPFYLKYLGAEAYGLVGFFTMLMSWLALLDLGLSATLIKETATLKDKVDGLRQLKQLTVSIEVFFCIVSALIFIIIFLGSNRIAIHWLKAEELSHKTIGNCLIIMATMVGLHWFIGLYQGCIIGFERQVWLNIYKIFMNTLRFIGAFILIKYITNEIYYFFIYQLLIGLIEFLLIKIKINSLLTVSQKIKPSFTSLKSVAPFAISIAYVSGLWIFTSQLDKLMLSHYLPLKEYGYFTLAAIVANGILQLFQPIGQAILPHMTSLISNHKKVEMINLYHRSTQIVSAIVIPTAAMVAFFSYELLYAWTGDIKAATWSAPILFWYALGNGAVALSSFQYYMQYAHGNLKYHVRGNSLFGFIQIAIIIYAVCFYGAIGVAIAWFVSQIFLFLVWPAYIHNKFAKGIHKTWLVKDILPSFWVTMVYVTVLKFINIKFDALNRIEILMLLIFLGLVLLIVATLSYKQIREIIFQRLFKKARVNV